MPLHIATLDDIRAGRVTDVYFERTRQVVQARGANKRVRAEFIAKSLPAGWPWAVLAGIEECAAVLDGVPVNVRWIPEGTVFRPFEPVFEIEGPYLAFGVLETALLGLICQASGVATEAARCRVLAGDRTLLSFGARRLHPSIAPMVERAAYVGGCDGVAVVASAELIGREPAGTMPHALVLLFGDTVEAVRAFDEVVADSVPRIALIDTLQDEKFEALRIAEALGPALSGVRLDTPASRRGDFRQIVEEVRWELDLRGYQSVRIYVSGGINERLIADLRDLVDGFGVGTEISDAPVVDFAMDIVEVDGRPLAKRGKWSGAKQVWRCQACASDRTLPLGIDPGPCACGGGRAPLLVPALSEGRLLGPLPPPAALRQRVLDQLPAFPVEIDE